MDNAYSIQQTGDDGYIVAGATYSFGSGNNADAWVLKLNAYGVISALGDFISGTSINPVNSAAPSANTNASISSLSINITETGISGVNSGATVIMICSSCLAPRGLTNNTVTDLNGCAYTGIQIAWNSDPEDWGDEGTGMRTDELRRDGIFIAGELPYSVTTYVDIAETNGQTYVYKVRYVNGCGNSATTPGSVTGGYQRYYSMSWREQYIACC